MHLFLCRISKKQTNKQTNKQTKQSKTKNNKNNLMRPKLPAAQSNGASLYTLGIYVSRLQIFYWLTQQCGFLNK